MDNIQYSLQQISHVQSTKPDAQCDVICWAKPLTKLRPGPVVSDTLLFLHWALHSSSCPPHSPTHTSYSNRNSIHHNCSIQSLKLEHSPGRLPTLRWDLDGSHIERLQQTQNPKLPHGGNLGMSGVQALLLFGLWYVTLGMATLHLARTVESMKIGQDLNSLSIFG